MMTNCWGDCDYRQLKRLRENLGKLQSVDLEQFCREVSRELAARLLALVIPRTPVGNYKGGSYSCAGGQTHKGGKVPGKVGGTLRQGWTARDGSKSAGGAKGYANSLPVERAGNAYRVEVMNPVEYASYVEFGHRTANGKGWVKGHYFLTISEQELKDLAPGLIERKLNRLLQEVFRG